MPIRNLLGAAVSVMLVAKGVHAHPGHAVESSDSTSLTHYLTHPDHLALFVFIIVAVVGCALATQRHFSRAKPAYAPAPRREILGE